jgi:RNAse (barnase) inhibitor barstar
MAENDFDDGNAVWATCADVEGFFTCPDNPEGRRLIGLLDAAVSGPVLEYCAGRRRGDKVHSNANLQILDLVGEVIGEYFMIILRCYDCIPHGHEMSEGKDNDADRRYDATLDIIATGTPPAVKEIWQRWSHDLPRVKNLWADYSSHERLAWLEVVRSHDHPGLHPDAPPGTTFELDGQYVTDYAGLFCAIGEAINGPGGYFGGDLNALDDCLNGDFGARIPFTLRWQNFDVAARHLNKPLSAEDYSLCGGPLRGSHDMPEDDNNDHPPENESIRRSFLDEVLEVLEEKLVSIVRA